MTGDWIKIARKMKKWEWYHDSEAVHLFLHFLIEANHAPKKWKGVEIKRGQFITGRKVLARDTGISENKIRQRMKWFEDTQEITIKSTSKFTIVTICKYDQYQGKEESKPPTDHQQTTNKPPTNHHNQEVKEDKERKEEKKETVPANGAHSDIPDFLQ